MKTVILAILLFLVLIFPHELGHFIAAKKCGVKVNEFSFGMGPAIFKKKKGETQYSIRILPIGGYCAMEGENEDSTDDRAFVNKKPWQRLIILLSGAFMNFLIAFLIMIILTIATGFTTTKLDEVNIDSPAYVAGIREGDKVIKIDENEITNWNQVGTFIQGSNGNSINITVLRENEEKDFTVTPNKKEYELSDGSIYVRYEVGIVCKVSHNPIKGTWYGIRETFSLFGSIFESFKMLFVTHEAGIDDLSGPVGIVKVVSDSASYGLWYYFILVALISVNLGIINLFPLPALDGGRIIFVLYTLITKKPVNQKVEGVIHAVGIVLLLLLSAFITYKDILKLF